MGWIHRLLPGNDSERAQGLQEVKSSGSGITELRAREIWSIMAYSSLRTVCLKFTENPALKKNAGFANTGERFF